MTESPERRNGRLWLTVGEVAAVIVAGLNYWDSHREHEAEARREAAQAKQATLSSALVLEAQVQSGGRRLAIRAVDPGQVIESQRYLFPSDLLNHPVDVTAVAPGVDAALLAPGLIRQLDARHAPPDGQGRAPVAILTSYLAGGDVRQDRSLYLVGYAWRRPFLHGREIILQGLAFRGRLPAGDPQAAVERARSASR